MADIIVGLNEVEALGLSAGFAVEARAEASAGANVKAVGASPGVASGLFAGSDGYYRLTVSYFNEDDGASPFSLLVDGVVVETWSGVGGSGPAGALATHTVTVALEEGSLVELTGAKDAGEYARIDSLLVEPASGATDPVAAIGLGRTEAEDLTLAGYQLEARSDASGGFDVRTKSQGTISGEFTGDDGRHTITVDYFDESDGVASYSLAVNGEVVETWRGTAGGPGGGTPASREITVDLAAGDVITLTGVRNAGELARVDAFVIAPTTGEPDPEPTPGVFALGRTEAENLFLSAGYTVEDRDEASGGANVRTTSSGTISGTFEGEAGSYFLDIKYFNESDGQSRYALAINGETVHTFEGLGGSGGIGVLTGERVLIALKAGDTISLTGVRNAGEFARVDAFVLESAGDTPPPPSGTLVVGLNEVETLDLDGYQVETRAEASGGANVKAPGIGEASGVFDGPDGTYRITTSFFNENDGVSPYKLAVNGTVVDTWSGVGGGSGGGFLEARSYTLSLSEGDEITLTGAKHQGEYARLDSLFIEAVASEPTVMPQDADVFAFLGQSNAERHFYRESGDTSSGKLGAEVFADAISERTLADVTTIEGARGGSGSNPLADPNSFWWDLENNRPGQPLYEAVSAIRAAIRDGRDLDAIIWSQGEDDAQAIAANGSNTAEIVDAMKEATLKTFDYLWDRFGRDVPVYIQQLGDHPDGEGTWLGTPIGAIDAVRQGQAELIAETDGVFLGATTDGADRFDTIHFSVAGYGSIAEELATSFLSGLDSDVPFA